LKQGAGSNSQKKEEKKRPDQKEIVTKKGPEGGGHFSPTKKCWSILERNGRGGILLYHGKKIDKNTKVGTRSLGGRVKKGAATRKSGPTSGEKNPGESRLNAKVVFKGLG